MTYIYYYYDVLDWIHSDHIRWKRIEGNRETEKEVKYRNDLTYRIILTSHPYCDVVRTAMKSIWRAGARCLAKLCTLSWRREQNKVVCAIVTLRHMYSTVCRRC